MMKPLSEIFHQIWMIMECYGWVDINAPPHSEACFYFVLKGWCKELMLTMGASLNQDLNQGVKGCDRLSCPIILLQKVELRLFDTISIFLSMAEKYRFSLGFCNLKNTLLRAWIWTKPVMIAQWDSSLSVLPVARVQFPAMAEYFKGFFPGWSHSANPSW